MGRFLELLRFEILIHNRSYHLVRNSSYIMLFSTIIFALIIPSALGDIYNKMALCLFGAVLAIITIPHYLIKIDLSDGSLETLLSIMEPWQIICAKYFALVINIGLSISISLVFSIIFLDLFLDCAVFLAVAIILVLLQFVAFILFGNIIQGFFKANTSMIIILILPMIIPTIIISAMALESYNIELLMILIGVNMILIPVIGWMSSYLLSNIYNT